jgi:hypothetical protein
MQEIENKLTLYYLASVKCRYKSWRVGLSKNALFVVIYKNPNTEKLY